jgi:hypothetical protein
LLQFVCILLKKGPLMQTHPINESIKITLNQNEPKVIQGLT